MATAPVLPGGFELPLEPRLPRLGSVDAVALEERAASLATRSIKRDSKMFALDLAIRVMDLTTLEGADTPGKVAALASKGIRPDPSDPNIPSVAAICVYPNLVPYAVARTKGTNVKVAAVATAFPSGQSSLEVKLLETREVVAAGAQEVDMVIDRGAFLSGHYAKVYDEIVRVKEICAGRAHLKVILETGELGTYDNVRRASLLAIAGGADFIKTSTGKLPTSATLPVTLCMLEVIRDVHEETGRVVRAARDAFANGWSGLRPSERAKYLFRIARLLQERSREFAVLESLNGGKPIRESRDVDVPLAAAHLFYYAGWADKLEYAFPNRKPRPIGVAGQIIPWNFPLLMLAWKIAPALAAGNTVVLKPAETTPLTALLFCDVVRQAELPAGVVNIVTGDGRTGAEIVAHPDVDKIAFTGSTEVGKAIQKALAGTDKRLTLELGGKAANIIFDDAPLDQAVEGIVNGIYFNQGHVCCAGSRLLVEESIYED